MNRRPIETGNRTMEQTMKSCQERTAARIRVKLLSALAVLAAVLLIPAVHALACTGIYIGSEVSEDGSTIFARSNDHMSDWGNYILLTDRAENTEGRTMPVSRDGSVVTEIPAETYRYVGTPWMDSTTAQNGLTHDAGICANECGVAMSMSVTAFANETAQKADPYIDNGVSEQSETDLVICQCATAREAVDLLLEMVDRYGCAEGAVTIIADRTEAWLVELYTGYQYAAVKLPADKAAAFGNEFTLEYLSDYEESIASKDLESLPEKNGFAKYGPDGEFNIRETYLGTENYTDYSHMRTWIGHKVLAPSAYGDYDREAQYPLAFTPDRKVSVQDVMELLRNRYEGTEYSPEETGRDDVRVIGTDTAMSVHVAQVYPDLPAEFSCVVWESTGPALCGAFVPVSAFCAKVSEAYAGNQSAKDAGVFDTERYPWYVCKELCTLGMLNYSAYAAPVRAYWHQAETDMTAGMQKVLEAAEELYGTDPAAAEELITAYCCRMQENVFSDGKAMLNTLRWAVSENANTLKHVFDGDTGRILPELLEPDPVQIGLDGAKYQETDGGAEPENG